MFATPQRSTFGAVKVYLRAQPETEGMADLARRKRLAQVTLGRFPLEVYRVGRDSYSNAFLWVSSDAEMTRLEDAAVVVARFRRERDIRALVDDLFRFNYSSATENRAVVTFSDLRLDLSQNRIYSDVHVFACDRGGCARVGRYRTDTDSMSAVLGTIFADHLHRPTP